MSVNLALKPLAQIIKYALELGRVGEQLNMSFFPGMMMPSLCGDDAKLVCFSVCQIYPSAFWALKGGSKTLHPEVFLQSPADRNISGFHEREDSRGSFPVSHVYMGFFCTSV